MTRSLYIVGAPATGKSTLMAQLLTGWEVGPHDSWGPHISGHYLRHPKHGHGVYIGHLRPEYPGTDALSLRVYPYAVRWLETLPLLGLDWVLGEGIRLGFVGFLETLAQATDLTLVHLEVPAEETRRRRIARGGKLQTEGFCRSAVTKAANVADYCREAGIPVLDGEGARRALGS